MSNYESMSGDELLEEVYRLRGLLAELDATFIRMENAWRRENEKLRQGEPE